MHTNKRIWEIDFIRGIAIILMVIFHVIVDLKDFHDLHFEYLNGFWYYEGKLAAILFIVISGISCTFSRNTMKRGITVFAFGMVVTVATYFFDPQTYINFGILHFLGASMILASFLNKLGKKNVIFLWGTIIIIVGYLFDHMYVNSPYLFPVGLITKHYQSLDFYPLFPWFGIFLYGMGLGKTLYANKKSLLAFLPKHDFISLIGRHSLAIYLLHQPVLLTTLYVIFYFTTK